MGVYVCMSRPVYVACVMYVHAHVVYVCAYVRDRVCVYMFVVCVCTLTQSHEWSCLCSFDGEDLFP